MRSELRPRLIQWTLRQNFHYSIGQGKIPNPLEVALTTIAGIQVGIVGAILTYSLIWLCAWTLGFIMIKKGYYAYEQRYITELNPIFKRINDSVRTS